MKNKDCTYFYNKNNTNHEKQESILVKKSMCSFSLLRISRLQRFSRLLSGIITLPPAH